MLIPLIITLLVAVAVALMLVKSRAAGTGYVSSSQTGRLWRQRPDYAQRNHRPAVQRSDFSAVAIQCGPECCQAARRLEGKRGFPSQIPRLPLSQCDADSCTCSYVEHDDRRDGDDRRSLYVAIVATGPEAQERRLRNDRRKTESMEDMELFNFRDQ